MKLCSLDGAQAANSEMFKLELMTQLTIMLTLAP